MRLLSEIIRVVCDWLERNLLNLGLAVIALAALAFSIFVGYHVRTESGDYNWDLAAIVGTALGTTLLAIATYILSSSTRVDVRASTALAKTAQSAADREQTPIVLLERITLRAQHTKPNPEGKYFHRFEISLRNVGQGAVVRGTVHIVHVAPLTGNVTLDEGVRLVSLVSGERLDRHVTDTFMTEYLPKDWSPSEFTVTGAFLDVRGGMHGLHDGQPQEPKDRFKVNAAGPTVGI